MNKEILNIELGLENCEVHTYDGKYIDKLIVGEIRTEIIDYNKDEPFTLKRTDEFYLKVSSEANISESLDANFRDSRQRPFTRITKHDDICIVIINYKDGDVDEFYVEWDETENYYDNNPFQKSLIDVDGSLHISVKASNKEEN